MELRQWILSTLVDPSPTTLYIEGHETRASILNGMVNCMTKDFHGYFWITSLSYYGFIWHNPSRWLPFLKRKVLLQMDAISKPFSHYYNIDIKGT